MKKTIRLTLIEEMLGTKAANPDVFADFIATKHPSQTAQPDEIAKAKEAAERLETAEHREEAGTTIFHRAKWKECHMPNLENTVLPADPEALMPVLYDYCIKGFFKDACGAMNRFDKEERGGMDKLTAYKTKIDGCIFVAPRFIPLILPAGEKVGVCERPLRAETAQGPRVSLCRSETVPPGTRLEFTINILSKDLVPYVDLWLGYGQLRGLGCWRNSGKGRFVVES